jgi:hypothetical protein
MLRLSIIAADPIVCTLTDVEHATEEDHKKGTDRPIATLDAYEASHIPINAQAISVLNIWVLMPMVLDRVANHYGHWCSVFLVILDKYALTDHVLIDMANIDHPEWVQMDYTMLM